MMADEDETAKLVGSPMAASINAMINTHDLSKIVGLQQSMLKRFEKTNAKLDSFNDLSAAKLAVTLTTFKAHTNLLIQAKTDLDSVYRRIRDLKARLSLRHPEAFDAVASGQLLVAAATPVPEDEDEEPEAEAAVAEAEA